MALLVVAVEVLRRYRSGLAGLLVFSALLVAPVAAHASGTVTVDGAGVVTWVGGQLEADTIVLSNNGSVFGFTQTSGGTITLVDTSGGVVTASNLDEHTVQVGPGTGTVTSIVMDDLGAYNTVTVDRVATTVPITLRNTSGVTGQDAVGFSYDNEEQQYWTLTNTGAVLQDKVALTVDYASTTRARLTVTGGSVRNDVLLNYSGAAGGLNAVIVNLGIQADKAVIQSTAAAAPVTIHGVGATDAVDIGNAGSLAAINGTVALDSLFGRIALLVDGHLDAGKRTVTVKSSEITGFAPAAINYAGYQVSSLTILANDAGNTFTINSAVTGNGAATDNIIESGVGDDIFAMPQSLFTAKMTLKGGLGNNTLDFTGRAGDTNVNLQTGVGTDIGSVTGVSRVIGGNGADQVTVGGTATFTGGGGNDTLVVTGSSLADTCEVFAGGANAYVACTAPASFGVTTTAVEAITLNTGDGNDTVTVKSTLNGQSVTVNGGNQDDTVTVGEFGSTKNIRGVITVNGNAGTNTVTINDQNTVSADVVTVSAGAVGAGGADTLFGTGGRFAYSNLATLLVQTGTGADQFTAAPSQNTAITINAGDPAESPGDGINLITTGLTGTALSVNAPNGMFFASDRQALTFQGFESMLVDGVGLGGSMAFSASTYTVSEGGSQASIGLVRTGFAMGSASVTVTPGNATATGPDDFDNAPIVVTFNDGETTATALVPIVNDTFYEGNETVNLTLANPSAGAALGTQAAATLTIQENDPAPKFAVTGSSVLEGQTGTKTIVFQVSFTGATVKSATVDYATQDGTARVADNDYQAKSGHLTFQPGEQTQSVSVTVFGDTRVEPNETFNLVLSNPGNATVIGGPGVGLIQNDDTTCSPRPGVQTQTAAGSLTLTTNVTATPLNNQQVNLLTELRFGEMTNARVIVNGETFTSAKAIKLDPGQPFVTFLVQRIYPHMATTVPITLVDGCGEWKTMVGGGPHAGF